MKKNSTNTSNLNSWRLQCAKQQLWSPVASRASPRAAPPPPAPPGATRICSASYDRRSGDSADAVVTNINITTAFRYDTIVRSNGPNKHDDKYPLWPTIKSIIGDPVKPLRKYLSGRGEPLRNPRGADGIWHITWSRHCGFGFPPNRQIVRFHLGVTMEWFCIVWNHISTRVVLAGRSKISGRLYACQILSMYAVTIRSFNLLFGYTLNCIIQVKNTFCVES